PDDPEDFDDFQDDDGCPEPDNDMDGVPDAADRCPDQPETLNGFQDEDGCPDRGDALVVVTESRIEIKQQVNFATDSDRIIGRISFQILDVVAAVLRANQRIRIEIQGHTDSQGRYEHNVNLSQRRAEAVRNYLTGAGVAADRMVARGYGPDVPIADNRTRAGRTANRRVEFHIAVAQAPAQPSVDVPAPPDDMSFDGESAPAPTPEAVEMPVPPPVDVPLSPDDLTFE
ncbi:MAG: OmpA family protein, partial [Myxococcota bacterium]|nr:OmpA family protein [Myxococcota bacterium]